MRDDPEFSDQPTRSEHLAWCKRRALEFCRAGDIHQAFGSLASDLNKHPDTAAHLGITLGFDLLLAGHLSTPEAMEEFIEGFN